MDPNYQPARLSQMATVHGIECCAGDVFPFYRVVSGDGSVVHEGLVSGGSSGGSGYTNYGGGYGSGVLVLPAGRYSITVWLTTYNSGVAGAPRGECSTQVLTPAARRRRAQRRLPTQLGVHFPAGAIAVARAVGPDMARRATARYALVLLVTMAMAGCAFAPGATDPAAAHQRAQEVLSAWAAAVTAAGEHAAVTPVGELTGQIGDWEEAVGDNNKRALMAGMVASDSPLSEEAPPDGEVTWRDGMTTKVPLLSAQDAIVAIESTAEAPCSDCSMLLVTAAELTSGPIQTSRGPATAPIWEFTVQGTASGSRASRSPILSSSLPTKSARSWGWRLTRPAGRSAAPSSPSHSSARPIPGTSHAARTTRRRPSSPISRSWSSSRGIPT